MLTECIMTDLSTRKLENTSYKLTLNQDASTYYPKYTNLIRMILTMNNFSFNDNHYLQIHGTAMGTKMAPAFANLFFCPFRSECFEKCPISPPHVVSLHWWYFYDLDCSLDNLKIFIDYLNNIHPTIKFTSSQCSTNVSFLDVNVSLTNAGNISTDLYTKPTDKHQHLLYSSCHPLHTKNAIPFSLALRLRRICSTDETFNIRTAQLTTLTYSNEATNETLSLNKYNVPPTSHADSLYKPKTLTNLHVYLL